MASATPNLKIASVSAIAEISYRYAAQGQDGRRLTGTIDAVDAQTAIHQLELLRLRVTEISPLDRAVEKPTAPGKAIRGDEFIAFNLQLAHLAAAGLPLEAGLRLIARDLRRGWLAKTIQSISADLDRGIPLVEAFARHHAQFPPLYSHLLDAGVRSGNLSAVLLSFGQHLELVHRLRATLWRTLSYPLMVIAALLLVLTFLSIYVLPQIRELVATAHSGWASSFGRNFSAPSLPVPTQILYTIAPAAIWVAGIGLALFLIAPLLWAIARPLGLQSRVIDRLVLPLPLVGRALRLNLIARWCDALRIGVDAGMPLPAAIGLAGDAVHSPRLRRDGQTLIDRIEAGQPLDDGGRLRTLPATVPAAITLAAGHHDLPATLTTLAELYERQAELRIDRIPAIVTPVLVVIVASTIGFVVVALMLPLLQIMNSMLALFG